MIFASLLSIMLVPMLMTIFIRDKRLKPESQNPVSRFFAWLYDPIIRLALRWKWTALLINFAVVPLTIPLLFLIGSEFMPPLYEGSMLYMPTSPPGLSITGATRLLQVQDKILRQFPEVERVFGTVGRGTTSTDNTPNGDGEHHHSSRRSCGAPVWDYLGHRDIRHTETCTEVDASRFRGLWRRTGSDR